MGGYYMSIESK